MSLVIDCKWGHYHGSLDTETHMRRMFRRWSCTFSSTAGEWALCLSVCVCLYLHAHVFEWMSCSIHLPELFHFLSITVVIALKKKNTSGQEISFSCFYPTSLSCLPFFRRCLFLSVRPINKVQWWSSLNFWPHHPKRKQISRLWWIPDRLGLAHCEEREIWWKCEWAVLTGYVRTSTGQADE